MGKQKLPADLAPASEAEKRTICVDKQRDALAVAQVMASMGAPLNTKGSEGLLVDSTVALYRDFGAADAVDSILARVTVGIGNMTMDCLARAFQSTTITQRELELNYGTKGALVLAALSKAIDARRGQGKQTVNVGQVNIEPGAQAIVGNVTPGTTTSKVPHNGISTGPADPEPAPPKK